uniref:Uncharacterized protein n=1 Tax=Octopus bimaculoides TaxID=37653 RepID=A0A0L8IG90_OCTBM
MFSLNFINKYIFALFIIVFKNKLHTPISTTTRNPKLELLTAILPSLQQKIVLIGLRDMDFKYPKNMLLVWS